MEIEKKAFFEKISKEKEFEILVTTFALENEMLLSLFSKLEKLIDTKEKPDMKEVFDVIQLDELINRISFKKLHQDEDEVMDYAKRAQKMVEKWKLSK